MILRVGLTGGIGSGKSTVGRMLAALGCSVIDADRIVDQLYLPGESGWLALRARFGDSILRSDQSIDRQRVSELALSSPQGASELNSLIHPLVIARQMDWLRELESDGADHIAVIEATLLIESGGRARTDRLIVVSASQSLRLDRAVDRGLAESEVRRRMARQIDDAQRETHADYVIVNEGSLDELQRRVRDVHRSLLDDLEQKKRPRE